MIFINLAPTIKHNKRCGACGEHGHMRMICPNVPYNGETLADRRKRQDKHRLTQQREYWTSHRQQERANNKRNYEKHVAQRIASVTNYRTKNPDKVKRWRDKFWAENGERVKAERKAVRERLYNEDPKGTWLMETFRAARVRAKKNGLPFDQDVPILGLPDICPVLGIKLVYRGLLGKPSPASPSLDRIRPELGYVANNLRVISNRANTLKNNATVDELQAVIRYMEDCGCA